MATVTQPQGAEAAAARPPLVGYRTEGPIAILTMDDPPANTYTYEMMRELDEAILRARFDDAIQQLKQVEAKRPQLAAAYELEGGIYYVQKKFKEALDAYTIATRINPKNPQSVRMRDLLEEQLGKRALAGKGGQ